MKTSKKKVKSEQQIPKWVLNRRYQRSPFVFFLLGIFPLSLGLILGILYLKRPKVFTTLQLNTANLSLEKISFRDDSSILNLDLDTLKLKAFFYKDQEDRYLNLVDFPENFGQDELEYPNSTNKSIQDFQKKINTL